MTIAIGVGISRWTILLLVVLLALAFILVLAPEAYAGGSSDDDDDDDSDSSPSSSQSRLSGYRCYYEGRYVGTFYTRVACVEERLARRRQERWEAANPVCSVTGTRMSASKCSNLVVCDVEEGTLAGTVTTITACNAAKDYIEYRDTVLTQTACERQVERIGTCFGGVGAAALRKGQVPSQWDFRVFIRPGTPGRRF